MRSVYSRAQSLQDDRGYNYFAGVHGLPLPIQCEHGSLLFLPWHRAYLYFFELALQDLEPNVSVPWWDWTSATSHQKGLPAIYSTSREEGNTNPLFATTVNWSHQEIQRVIQVVPDTLTKNGRTQRKPDIPGELPRRKTIEDILDAPTFEDFSLRLENVHNAVHLWVGGAMSQVPTAAYDPIFWSHHSMIDRLWYLWQLRHPGLDPPIELLGTVLTPFPITVAQTLNIESLGYEYAVQIIM